MRNALSSDALGDYSGVVGRVLQGSEDSAYVLFNDDFVSRLSDFACGNPRCCAEASLIWSMLEKGFKPLTLEFFSTDTNAAELCTMALARCFSRHVNVAGYVRVRFFGGGDLMRGFVNLVDALGRELSNYLMRGFEVFIGISGGMKIEVVASVLVASILGARLVYVSESGELVILPRLPLSLRREVLEGDLASLPGDLLESLESLGLLRRGASGLEFPRWLLDFTRGGRPSART